MNAAVRFQSDIVKPSDVNPIAEVLPANFRVESWGPCDGQRVHPIFVLEDMGSIATILSPAPRDNTIVGAIVAPVFVQELQQLAFPLFPIDLLLLLGEATGITNAISVDMQRSNFPISSVPELDTRARALIGHHATLTEYNLFRQSVFRFELFRHFAVPT